VTKTRWTGPMFRQVVPVAILAGLFAGCSRSKQQEVQPLEPREPLADLAFVHGEVTVVEADGTRRPAAAGPLAPGGRLVAGRGSRAVVKLADGGRLEIGENGQLDWQSSGEELVVVPGRAVIVSQPPANKGNRPVTLVIQTPYGIARVPAEGTEAAFEVVDGRAEIDVRLGRVDFQDKKGKRIELKVGERIEVMLAGVEIIRSDGSRTKLGAEEVQAKAPVQPADEAAHAPSEGESESEAEGEAEPEGEGETAAAAAAPKPQPAPGPPPVLPAPPPAPLVLPMATDLRVAGDPVQEVTLTWPESLNPGLVEVARDHLFRRIILAGVPQGAHVNVAPPRAGSLYWRVLDNQGSELKRGKAKFQRDLQADSGGRGSAQAVVSDTGAAAKLFYQSPVPVTFTYTPHPHAAGYHLHIARAAGKKAAVFDGKVRKAGHTLKAGTLRDGQYVWKATPLDASGSPIGEGRENRLTISYDNASTDLDIRKPRSGQRVQSSQVQVQGVAPLGSKLFVNGKRAPLDSKGRFDFRVDRAPALIFRVVTPDGDVYWVRGLRLGTAS
jgi:hypothetical protein